MGQGRQIGTDKVERLLDGLRVGMTRRAAAAHAGMHHSTLYRMLANDATLATEVEKAENEAEGTYTAIVAKAAEKNWTAAAWWLERRHSADFGRKDRVEMTVDLKGEARKLADELGLDVDEVMAEAEAVLRGGA